MGQTMDPQRLKQLRKSRGLKQYELAQKAQLNPQTVYRLESERRPVRKRTLEHLAQALQFDPEVLVGEKPMPLGVPLSRAPLRTKPLTSSTFVSTRRSATHSSWSHDGTGSRCRRSRSSLRFSSSSSRKPT
jgi:transcriptional regulator with XRE-family HTH domain